jgi:predicted nucleic acid-binding protein
VIVVDTSLLIDALTGARRSALALRKTIEQGERLLIPSLVLYEWLRGPRRRGELAAQEALFPKEASLPFGPQEAEMASELYKTVRRPRGREIDLAIAAHAMARDAELWTLNTADFRDIQSLRLWLPPR